jgi:iron complex transport system substrate-binding protein
MWIDQLGNQIERKSYQRIVSIVPSQTELLYEMGLGERVVGITKFCIHPDSWYSTKARVGGTKNVAIDRVRALEPDLIIGNKEENDKENIGALKEIAPLWMSDIYNLKDNYAMIHKLGQVLAVEKQAQAIIEKINHEFTNLKPFGKGKRCLYLIWRNPYMGAAKNTFIDFMLTKVLGFINALEKEVRYPQINLESFAEVPDYIFLSSEPYPFNSLHIQELNAFFPASKIILVDGELFSWYGSRLIHAPAYFKELMHQL